MPVRTPRYLYANDFKQFYAYFLAQPHTERRFRKGEYLWRPGRPYEKIHYIVAGTAMHYADHEGGSRKIISFHSGGTVYPGYRQDDYKIELSLTTVALSEMTVLEFTKEQFGAMFRHNTALSEAVVNWYASYINRFLFETTHQEYNSSLVKLCNLLFLLHENQPAGSCGALDLSQDELAALLGISRVQLTRGLAVLRSKNIVSTGRNKVEILDLPLLSELCTSEVLSSTEPL